MSKKKHKTWEEDGKHIICVSQSLWQNKTINSNCICTVTVTGLKKKVASNQIFD